MSMTPEEYTADLVRRILPVVTEFHPDIPPDAAEHLVTEALFVASNDVRRGRTAKLEYIGDLARIDGRVAFRPCDWIADKMTAREAAHYDQNQETAA